MITLIFSINQRQICSIKCLVLFQPVEERNQIMFLKFIQTDLSTINLTVNNQ